MKKLLIIALFSIACLNPIKALAAYHVEILQAGRLDPFEQAYQGIIKGFEQNGFVLGRDMDVNRTVIDINPETELYVWENLRVLMRIKSTADEIIQRKPDLVITIGTFATRYSRPKIVKAGIPLVFTCVAVPEAVGCISKTDAGPGATGVTTYLDPRDIIQTARQGLPNLKKLGLIHSDDDNASAYAEEMRTRASEMGVELVIKQVNLWQKMNPVAEEMISQGVEAFFVPVDRYYRVRGFENAKSLMKLTGERKIPCISSAVLGVKGPLFYPTRNFSLTGTLTADQAAKILKKGMKPETLPIIRQSDSSILVDSEMSKSLDIDLPTQLLSRFPKPADGQS